jgi:hypothetical protein
MDRRQTIIQRARDFFARLFDDELHMVQHNPGALHGWQEPTHLRTVLRRAVREGKAAAPSAAPVSVAESESGRGSPPEEQVLRQCGPYTLVRGAQGLWWVLTSRVGSVWYWHPEVRLWVGARRAYRTEEEATAGLEKTLAHEQAGSLDKQPAPAERLLPAKPLERPAVERGEDKRATASRPVAPQSST